MHLFYKLCMRREVMNLAFKFSISYTQRVYTAPFKLTRKSKKNPLCVCSFDMTLKLIVTLFCRLSKLLQNKRDLNEIEFTLNDTPDQHCYQSAAHGCYVHVRLKN